jgi:hypothetical protein
MEKLSEEVFMALRKVIYSSGSQVIGDHRRDRRRHHHYVRH